MRPTDVDVDFSERHQALRQIARRFIDADVRPLVEEYTEREEYPVQLLRKLGPTGLLGLMVGEAYGGCGPDVTGTCILIDELARVDGGIAASTVHHISLGMGPIFLLGNREQKERYLVPGVRGELLCCFALTEPSGGSDAAAVRTTARRDGDQYVLNGSKTFITNGGFSDVICVAARTDPSAVARGISLFLVDRNTPGFSVGKKVRKIGWHTSDTVELFFDDCRVSAENLLGEENRGFHALMQTLEAGRIIFAAYCVGVAVGAFEDALAYARARHAFGNAIGSYQAIQFMLADMQTDVTVARTFVYRMAEVADRGESCREQAAMAKLFASEMADRVTHKAVQIHGGYGFCREYKVARAFCDARIGQIGEGTSEIQRTIISRALGL